jgi:hypothetical protein
MVEGEDLRLPNTRYALSPTFLSLEFGHDYDIFLMSEAYRLDTSYRATILETDKKILPQRVSVAEAAVIARRREIFYADGTAEEKEALEDALYALHAFKTPWQHSDAA